MPSSVRRLPGPNWPKAPIRSIRIPSSAYSWGPGRQSGLARSLKRSMVVAELEPRAYACPAVRRFARAIEKVGLPWLQDRRVVCPYVTSGNGLSEMTHRRQKVNADSRTGRS